MALWPPDVAGALLPEDVAAPGVVLPSAGGIASVEEGGVELCDGGIVSLDEEPLLPIEEDSPEEPLDVIDSDCCLA